MYQHPLSAVAERRKLLKIKAATIAQRVGMTTESYRRLERGERRCYVDKAIAISRMLDCTVEDLGRDLTPEERIELFRAGDKQAELLARAGGDTGVAKALATWGEYNAAPDVHNAPNAPDIGLVVTRSPSPAHDDAAELADVIASWSADDAE
jgi:DNA-binding XRE family transcriptional regulator